MRQPKCLSVLAAGHILIAGPAAVSLTSSNAWSQETLVSLASFCAHCRVDLLRVATLGDTAGPGMVHQQGSVAMDAGRHFYVSSNGDPGTIRHFDSSGRYAGTIGRPGRGPGEYVGRPLVSFLSADTMLAVDSEGRRATVLDGSYEVVRSIALPMIVSQVVATGSGGMVVTGDDRSAARIGLPLHLIDFRGDGIRSFGAINERVDFTNPFGRFRTIGPSRSNASSVWSARINEYLVERWDTSGRLHESLRRDPEWFRPWTRPAAGLVGVTRQVPSVTALFERGDSLWVLVRVDDAGWKPMPPVPVPGMSDAFYTPDSFRDSLFDTLIEVLHVSSGRLLASQRVPQHLLGFAADEHAFSYEEDEHGNPRYVVWRLRVARP